MSQVHQSLSRNGHAARPSASHSMDSGSVPVRRRHQGVVYRGHRVSSRTMGTDAVCSDFWGCLVCTYRESGWMSGTGECWDGEGREWRNRVSGGLAMLLLGSPHPWACTGMGCTTTKLSHTKAPTFSSICQLLCSRPRSDRTFIFFPKKQAYHFLCEIFRFLKIWI